MLRWWSRQPFVDYWVGTVAATAIVVFSGPCQVTLPIQIIATAMGQLLTALTMATLVVAAAATGRAARTLAAHKRDIEVGATGSFVAVTLLWWLPVMTYWMPAVAQQWAPLVLIVGGLALCRQSRLYRATQTIVAAGNRPPEGDAARRISLAG